MRDEEAEEIERKMRQGWRGPLLLRWVERLLQDRGERRARERRIRELLEEGERQDRPPRDPESG